jgi:hypothetical protein
MGRFFWLHNSPTQSAGGPFGGWPASQRLVCLGEMTENCSLSFSMKNRENASKKSPHVKKNVG